LLGFFRQTQSGPRWGSPLSLYLVVITVFTFSIANLPAGERSRQAITAAIDRRNTIFSAAEPVFLAYMRSPTRSPALWSHEPDRPIQSVTHSDQLPFTETGSGDEPRGQTCL